jgi:hypothetical protein
LTVREFSASEVDPQYVTLNAPVLRRRCVRRGGSGEVVSALDAGITLPDAPYLVLVGGLSVVGELCRDEGTARPAELQPLFGLPPPEDAVEEAADEPVAEW